MASQERSSFGIVIDQARGSTDGIQALPHYMHNSTGGGINDFVAQRYAAVKLVCSPQTLATIPDARNAVRKVSLDKYHEWRPYVPMHISVSIVGIRASVAKSNRLWSPGSHGLPMSGQEIL